MNLVSEGAYRNGAMTGLITGIAAGTASAGHLWAVRWAPATNSPRKVCVIRRLTAIWTTIAGFTAAQEVQLQLFKLTGYTAAHTGGNAIAPSKKQVTSIAPAALLTGRIANTAELTAGTQTLDTDPLAVRSFPEFAAATNIARASMVIDLWPADVQDGPIVLEANEGLLLLNGILMGAGGTARLSVDLDWAEVAAYPGKFTATRLV